MRSVAKIWKGGLEVVVGSYPRFAFGGSVGNIIPIFHFHEAEPVSFEEKLRYLAENEYRTISSDEIYEFIKSGKKPHPRAVALCFDDAWSSLWTVVLPLLKQYSMRSIAFAVPARLSQREGIRPDFIQDRQLAVAADRSSEPFCRVDELRAMYESGHVDVQSHTFNHWQLIAGTEVVDYVTPDYQKQSLLRRPYLLASQRQIGPDDLGFPLFRQASRMDDTGKFLEDRAVFENCRELVAAKGGVDFFEEDDWRSQLDEISKTARMEPESSEMAESAIRKELADSRDALNDLLGRKHVRHICFPWGIAGNTSLGQLHDAGYLSAIADKLTGYRAAKPGQDPYNVMRLHERFIHALPGVSRRYFQLFH